MNERPHVRRSAAAARTSGTYEAVRRGASAKTHGSRVASTLPVRPEILAPAGNEEMMRAAVENGADAVYFGVQAFNARLRADNFTVEGLPRTMRYLHERGVRGYLTLNILVFEHELPEALALLRAASAAGVDAVLVQDLGLAAASHLTAPELPLHASTQMTLSCAESVAATDALGLKLDRVVVPRELSRRELRRFLDGCDRELETFVHGALCVAYSGQCLTSEALGGRSANRGECAQACRLPYTLVVDGEERDLGDVRYLLSPMDLAAHDDVPELAEMGIASLKIEGRLKTPEYVAATVQAYRAAMNASIDSRLRLQLEATFSRGFTGGYLHAIDHQQVVDGRTSSKRGTFVGEVTRVEGRAVEFVAVGPIKPGDGIGIDSKGRRSEEMGGTIYHLRRRGVLLDAYDPGDVASPKHRDHSKEPMGEKVTITFAGEKVDLSQIRPGDRLWKTADPAIERDLRASFTGAEVRYRRPVRATVIARTGEPLSVRYTDQDGESGAAIDDRPLDRAEQHVADERLIREQISRLGNTPFVLESLEVHISGDPMVPQSRLNAVRRSAVEALLTARRERNSSRRTVEMDVDRIARALEDSGTTDGNPRSIGTDTVLDAAFESVRDASPELSVLCRTMDQVQAALDAGVLDIYTDFEDPRSNDAARSAITAPHRFIPATLRVIKPGEAPAIQKLLRTRPDAVLVRNLASWYLLREAAPNLPVIGDHSLNVANSLTASLLERAGITRITPSYDLNGEQLLTMLRASHPDWFEVTIHQHMPMFHMEHCVFCRFLSDGTDASNCGRPCESHSLELLDRRGYAHPVKADSGCRNTVFNGVAQSGVEYVPHLLEAGVRRFRLDLLGEVREAAVQTITLYQRTLRKEIPPETVWSQLRATSRLGVTRGTLDHDSAHAHDALYTIRPKKSAHAVR